MKNYILSKCFRFYLCFSATSSVVLTNLGEAFYMLSSSELQRVALSARNCLQIKCRVPIPNNLKECEVSQSLQIAQMQIDVPSTPEHSVVSSSVVVEDYSYEKNNPQNEINNSTIVSVEPETSFGDMTLDSIKDHMYNKSFNFKTKVFFKHSPFAFIQGNAR